MQVTRDQLRSVPILEGLSDEQIDWFCDHGECVEVEAGERMFERGQVADALWIVITGLIQGFEEHGGQWRLVATTAAGEVTGMLPFSRMTHYPRHTVAAEPSVVMRLDASLFQELLGVSMEVGGRLVAQMSDRVRGDVRLEQQSEKLMALGRLSAGLAHELNNPAAAVRRAASTLSEHRVRLPMLVTALVRHQVGEEGLAMLSGMRERGAQHDATADSTLARSEREEALSDWLEGQGMPEPWEAGAVLAEAGLTIEDLTRLSEVLPEQALVDALAWMSGGIESDRIVGEITAAAGRISDLVASIKTYSHMDRSSEHKPTDVRTGLESTVTMLGHKIRSKGCTVVREYQEALPLIEANAGELNQVWTNLMDNAVDVVTEGGEMILRAKRNDIWIEVEIVDDGPGIPENIRASIFEPFFTTKEVGVGSGLGLGIANRIVKTHQGHIEIRSRPGETVMCVRLPIKRVSPVAR